MPSEPAAEPAAFIPPPYPHDRLGPIRARAAEVPGGMIDASVGTPVDPMPAVVLDALTAAAPAGTGYPATIGSPAFREAAVGWLQRRFGCALTVDDVIACIGTKEVVASLPRFLSLRNPARDTVLYPAVAYPTYEMGALLAGLRAVPVPVDDDWHLDLDRVDPADAERALLLWLNDPSNPTGAVATPERMVDAVEWARARGIVVASDECYAEFTYDDRGAPAPPVTALSAGTDGVLAVHSLSKRSNLAGYRCGFVAGDPAVVAELLAVRKNLGLIQPGPQQIAMAVALADDAHVEEQHARYLARRAVLRDALERAGFRVDHSEGSLYLWATRDEDCWTTVSALADLGVLVAPGSFYGRAGERHVRVALTATDERIAAAAARL
jgi:succinyldiaminopimelate transaminase